MPVILSGGSGTRLWPVSCPKKPKQLHSLLGNETLLQQTIRRVVDSTLFRDAIVVTAASHASEVEAQLTSASANSFRLILEPCGRNTAPAAALAALEAREDSILLLMPSDQVIEDLAAFHNAVQIGAPAAAEGWLVTFGISPEWAETGYGYIRRGGQLSDGLFQVHSFVEKPDLDTAQAWLADGNHYWNGGIFLIRAGTYLEALEEHASDILRATQNAMNGAGRHGFIVEPEAEAFASSRAQSIDHAIMEHASRVAVVPVEMGWSDLGSWDAIWHLSPKDRNGNVTTGPVTSLDNNGCLLRSDGPRLVTTGVEDLIVIVVSGAVLVMRRGDSQRVRDLVEMLDAPVH